MELITGHLFALILLAQLAACDGSPGGLPAAQATPTSTAKPEVQGDHSPEKKELASQSTNLEHLRSWIGKYPLKNASDKKGSGDFFNVPEIKATLSQLLGQDGFQNLLKHFAGSDLIKEKAGFLTMLGTSESKSGQGVNYALVAVRLENGETHVLFSDDRKLLSFSNARPGSVLPIEIKQEILPYTDAYPSAIIGTITQRPDSGYGCYAVLEKDWNVSWETRPYIFYQTDDGAKMNIESRDVELRLVNNTEKKGERGRVYVNWIYANQDIRAIFDLVVSEIPDSSAVIYEGTATVATHTKLQKVQVKAFCGG